MEQIDGYTGKILRADLSRNQFRSEAADPAWRRAYLGGVGLGARILYDEVGQGVGWSDPENRFILASGPLGGMVMGSGNFTVVTRGALSGWAAATQANGYFGAYLRFAGFDAIVIQGRAVKLRYLLVRDGEVELRDASHLAGRDTWETEALIREELGLSPQALSVFSIGPAGENLVRLAALVGDRGHVAGHNGVGAVMGSKNLKAIAIVRSQRRVKAHDPERLRRLDKEMFETVKDDALWSQHYRWGTLPMVQQLLPTGRVVFKNYTTNQSPMTREQLASFGPEYLREKLEHISRHPCWGCRMHHCDLIRIPEGPCAGMEGEEPEYEGYAAVGTQIGNYDGIAATALCNQCDRLGLEVNETGWLLGMIIEAYEEGILTKKDTDGLEMTWGGVAAAGEMMNRIARRQGIGDVLAEGVIGAVQKLGRGLEELAVFTRSGNTPLSHDHRRNWLYLFDTCVSNTGSTEMHIRPRASFFGIGELEDLFAHREVAAADARFKAATPFIDCLGVCRQANRELPEILIGMIQAATGWDFSLEEAIKAGLRATNLLRAFNIRHGYHAGLEIPSPRYGSLLTDGPARGKNIIPVWEEMRDIYYREMGWDRATGKPLPDTLRKLGLDDVVAELWPDKS